VDLVLFSFTLWGWEFDGPRNERTFRAEAGDGRGYSNSDLDVLETRAVPEHNFGFEGSGSRALDSLRAG